MKLHSATGIDIIATLTSKNVNKLRVACNERNHASYVKR